MLRKGHDNKCGRSWLIYRPAQQIIIIIAIYFENVNFLPC